jgi:ABC-type transporter Mla subunit MlaD
MQTIIILGLLAAALIGVCWWFDRLSDRGGGDPWRTK